jgi:DNA helicase HerA-like ATPase
VTDPIIHLSPVHPLNLAADRWRLQGLRAYVAGISGSGKTNLVAVFCEELYRIGVPFVIADPMDDYRSLRELGPGVKLASEDGGDIGLDYPLPAWIDAMIRQLAAGYSVVVDLKSIFAANEKRVAYTQMLTALLKRQQKAREPMFLVVEEAHIFCPQKRQQDLPALEITAEIARAGRRSGINLILASQRPRDLEADVAASCNLHFTGVLESWLDYEAVKHSLFVPAEAGVKGRPPRGLVSTEVTKTPQFHHLRDLKTGQFYVRVGAKLNLIQVRKRLTTHIGATPEIKAKQPPRNGNGP